MTYMIYWKLVIGELGINRQLSNKNFADILFFVALSDFVAS